MSYPNGGQPGQPQQWGQPEGGQPQQWAQPQDGGQQTWGQAASAGFNNVKTTSGFDPKKVARFDEQRLSALMNNEGIVRNRLKIASSVSNAAPIVRASSSRLSANGRWAPVRTRRFAWPNAAVAPS